MADVEAFKPTINALEEQSRKCKVGGRSFGSYHGEMLGLLPKTHNVSNSEELYITVQYIRSSILEAVTNAAFQ